MSRRAALLDSFLLLTGQSSRHLQVLPDYTSPPLPIALEATPDPYKDDAVMEEARAVAAAGNCTVDGNRCQIPFPVSSDMFPEPSKVGMVFYGGGLVDPRGYSVIAELVAERYGIPSVIPIFEADLAFNFGVCDTGRLDMAKAEFPDVEKWVLGGHSFGGVAAAAHLWQSLQDDGDEAAAGLVMLASDVQLPLGCGELSNTTIPMASLTASLDGVLNMTRWSENVVYASPETFFMDIYGATHASFGAYDASERSELLNQTDGVPLVPSSIVWDLTAASIAHVAARMGVPLPEKVEVSAAATNCEEKNSADEELLEEKSSEPETKAKATSAGSLTVTLPITLCMALLGTVFAWN